MDTQKKDCLTKGFVRTKFGRVRHLPFAAEMYKKYGLKITDKKWCKSQGLEDIFWKVRTMINNSRNNPIQGLAAHIVNRAALAINRQYKKLGIDAYLTAQIHDELTSICNDSDSLQVKDIVKKCMENTTLIEVPLVTEPLIADNWAEAK
jgi:DNA polymerase I-like protein with 3'-5' exonuclease and polymerase domains